MGRRVRPLSFYRQGNHHSQRLVSTRTTEDSCLFGVQWERSPPRRESGQGPHTYPLGGGPGGVTSFGGDGGPVHTSPRRLDVRSSCVGLPVARLRKVAATGSRVGQGHPDPTLPCSWRQRKRVSMLFSLCVAKLHGSYDSLLDGRDLEMHLFYFLFTHRGGPDHPGVR